MHTFRDTGGIDLAEQSSSAKNAERMLKREPRKNLLSGTTEWNRELGGYGGGLPPPTYAQARTAEEPLKRKKGLYLGKKACISESMHFSAMHHSQAASSVRRNSAPTPLIPMWFRVCKPTSLRCRMNIAIRNPERLRNAFSLRHWIGTEINKKPYLCNEKYIITIKVG